MALRACPTAWKRWARFAGCAFVNDSKATNVDAVNRALECFDLPVIPDHGREK